MSNKQVFEQYYSRLAKEGVLKALFCGLIVGFAVDFVLAFITWFFGYEWGLWVSLGAGIVCAVGATLLFYYKKFRPTTQQIARRVDRLGLEERLITMFELENDDSYIAMRQREDAKASLRELEGKKLKLAFSNAIIVVMAFMAIIGLSMTTVTTLAAEGIISSGMELLFPPEADQYFEIKYRASGEGGTILGTTEQVVLKGEKTSAVFAFAGDGYVFSHWEDGSINPVRVDTAEANTVYTAYFVLFEDVLPGDVLTDEPDDIFGQEGNGSGGPGNPNGGDGFPGMPSESEQNGDGDENDGAGGRYEESNQVIDGDTFYQDVYQDYFEQVMERIRNGEELTEEEKQFIEDYFGTVK